jgi:single-strand DNA-binding protein
MGSARAADGSANQVYLCGRLGGPPSFRDLPSGDVLAVFRLTVSRPPNDRARVDSLECVSTRPRVRRTLERAESGDWLELTGSLHRRFWRSPAGPTSRYAIDTETLRLKRADRRGGAAPARTPASA